MDEHGKHEAASTWKSRKKKPDNAGDVSLSMRGAAEGMARQQLVHVAPHAGGRPLSLPMKFEPSFTRAQVNYRNFMHGLLKENIQLNWKVLSKLSMHEPYTFKALVDVSRKAFLGNKVPKKEGITIVV